MLGIRLPHDAEQMLARHARSIGRGKSVVAREWIIERLQRVSVDEEMRQAARLISANTTEDDLRRIDADADDLMRLLDEEDGGYGAKGRNPTD